jgi:hypothetical protein
VGKSQATICTLYASIQHIIKLIFDNVIALITSFFSVFHLAALPGMHESLIL